MHGGRPIDPGELRAVLALARDRRQRRSVRGSGENRVFSRVRLAVGGMRLNPNVAASDGFCATSCCWPIRTLYATLWHLDRESRQGAVARAAGESRSR